MLIRWLRSELWRASWQALACSGLRVDAGSVAVTGVFAAGCLIARGFAAQRAVGRWLSVAVF